MPREPWNRNELYELVWAQPVTKVAEKFGVSNVAIAKVCRKLKVPVPGRGYWAKKVNGHPVQSVPLREAENLPEVFKPRPEQLRRPNQITDEDKREFARIEGLLECGALRPPADELHKRHSAITLTVKEARKAKEDWRRLLELPRGCLDLRVTRTSIDRALAVMAAVIAVCEANAIPVEVSDHGTTIRYLGERVSSQSPKR